VEEDAPAKVTKLWVSHTLTKISPLELQEPLNFVACMVAETGRMGVVPQLQNMSAGCKRMGAIVR